MLLRAALVLCLTTIMPIAVAGRQCGSDQVFSNCYLTIEPPQIVQCAFDGTTENVFRDQIVGALEKAMDYFVSGEPNIRLKKFGNRERFQWAKDGCAGLQMFEYPVVTPPRQPPGPFRVIFSNQGNYNDQNGQPVSVFTYCGTITHPNERSPAFTHCTELFDWLLDQNESISA